MSIGNLEEEGIRLPPRELQVLREMFEQLNSLSDEVIEAEEELESLKIALALHVSKKSSAATASRQIADSEPGSIMVVKGDNVIQIKDRMSALKKEREVAFRQMVGFLKGSSFSQFLRWAPEKASRDQSTARIEQALLDAVAEASAGPRSREVVPTPVFPEAEEIKEALKHSLKDLIRSLATHRLMQEPALGSAEVAEYLGSDASSNDRQYAMEHRKRGEILGVKVGNKYLYPAFQFDETRQEVYPIIKEVNLILSSGSDPWAVLNWWVSPNARLADNKAPKVLLSDPDKHSILKSLAEATIEDAG